MLLVETFPDRLDINRLVIFNHALLHTADLGGPASLLPPVPLRAGELGLKRQRIEAGLRLLIRVGLVEISTETSGIEFVAADAAESFVKLLESSHAIHLRNHAKWVVQHYGDMDNQTLRLEMRRISSHWVEEFEVYD